MPPHIPLSHSLSFYWALDNLWLDMLPFIWPIFSYSCFLHIFSLPSQLAIKVKRLKKEKNTATNNKKNSYTIHTVLTFISSSLCAGGRICYCHSFLRTRVCDKSTSPDFTSLFISFLQSSVLTALTQNLHRWPCLVCTAAEYSHFPSVSHCKWGLLTLRGLFQVGFVSYVFCVFKGGCC